MQPKCPDEERLADFVEGRLDAEARAEVESHLAVCDECLEAVTTARAITRGAVDAGRLKPVPEEVTREAFERVSGSSSGPTGGLGKRLRRRLEEIYAGVQQTLAPLVGLEAEPVPIRGTRHDLSDSLIRLQKTFKEATVDIEIQKMGPRRADIRVAIVNAAAGTAELRATLRRGGRDVASLRFDGGTALFEDVAFDRYRLVLSRERTPIGVYSFELRGEGA